MQNLDGLRNGGKVHNFDIIYVGSLERELLTSLRYSVKGLYKLDCLFNVGNAMHNSGQEEVEVLSSVHILPEEDILLDV